MDIYIRHLGAPAYRGVLDKLRAENVRDYWSLNSRSALKSINMIRAGVGLKPVSDVTWDNLNELESKLR